MKRTKNLGEWPFSAWLGARSPREPFLVIKYPVAKSIYTGFERRAPLAPIMAAQGSHISVKSALSVVESEVVKPGD
jgi:hypothetical protein